MNSPRAEEAGRLFDVWWTHNGYDGPAPLRLTKPPCTCVDCESHRRYVVDTLFAEKMTSMLRRRMWRKLFRRRNN